MSRDAVQYVLTIDGDPYAAASPSCSVSTTSSDADWPAGVIVLPGALDTEKLRNLSWDEEIKPITGETSAGGISLALNDLVPSSGPASGQNVWTYLFSRRPRYMTKTSLVTSLTDSAASVVVSNGAAFPAGDQIIWIDREAIHCSSRAANTFTVAASGRGYLGTRAAAHTIDEVNAFTPIVWADFPNPQRRRAILWMVSGTTATPIWRGYLGRAPRLDQQGARWELQLDHALTVQSNRALGPSSASVNISGYDPSTFAATFIQNGGAGAALRTLSVMDLPWAEAIPRSLPSCLTKLQQRLEALIASPAAGGISVGIQIAPTGDGRPQIRVTSSTVPHTIFLSRAWMPDFSVVPVDGSEAAEPWQAVEEPAGVYTSRRTMRYAPTTHVIARNGRASLIPVDRLGGIPTSGLSTSTTDGAVTTLVQWALAGTDPAGFAFHLELLTVTPADLTVRGVLRRVSVGLGARNASVQGDILFSSPASVQLVTQVSSGHWIRALQRGVFASSYGIDEQADPRDWDWSRANEVISATGGEYSSARVWVFDGSQTVGDFLKDALRLDVCAISFKASRLSIISLSPPLATDTASLTVDLPAGGGVHQRPPWFSTLPDGIVNVVRLTREDGPSITVNNQGSIAQFGLAPALELEAKGAIAQVVQDQSPFDLARGPFSRILGMWGIPSDMLRVIVDIGQLATTELGAIVDVASKSLPDGAGHRGISTTRRGRVYRRQIDMQSGTITIDVLIYGADRVAGYAPAVRVNTFSGTSNMTITAAVNYLTSSATATDYAGSNSANYAGTLNDGGVSKFAVGNYVKFRRVDDTAVTEEGGFVVTSVTPSGAQFTVNSNPALGATNWVTLLSGGAKVDVIADDYANAVTAQRGYAYLGDKATGEISSGVPNQEWAP